MSSKEELPLEKVCFLHVNDIYESDKIDGVGGLAQLGMLIKMRRAKLQSQGYVVFVIVSGDFLSASERALTYQGKHMVELFENWGVDFVCAGNHEFDFGPQVLLNRVKESTFPWLAANVFYVDTKAPLLPPATPSEEPPFVFQRTLPSGRKISFFGLCTPETPKLSYPGDSIYFEDPESVARKCLAKIGTSSDAIVAITHLRIAADKQLAVRLPLIDLFLGGHDHEPNSSMIGKTLVHKSGQNGDWLGEIKLHFWASSLKTFSYRMLLNGPDVSADADSVAILSKYIPLSNSLPIQRLAKIRGPAPLISQSGLCRTRETTMGNLVSTAIAAHWKNPEIIGSINGGYIRGNRVYLPGDSFTTQDLSREFPFPCSTVKISIKGSDLWLLLEQQLSLLPDPFGAFGHYHGLHRTYSPDATPLQRLREVTVYSHASNSYVPLCPASSYILAVSDFMFSGGDCITAFDNSILLERDETPIQQIVRNYLVSTSDLSIVNETRTHIILE